MFAIFSPRESRREPREPVEEEFLIADGETSRGRSIWTLNRIRFLVLAGVGCILGIFLLLRGCMPGRGLKVPTDSISLASSNSHLEKYAAPAASATSSVLNVFQVYQPVLTPEGPTDETVLGDGSENTTSLSSASSGASCQVLLMDHVFALSYGAPFVGMFCFVSFCYLYTVTLICNRGIYSTRLQV